LAEGFLRVICLTSLGVHSGTRRGSGIRKQTATWKVQVVVLSSKSQVGSPWRHCSKDEATPQGLLGFTKYHSVGQVVLKCRLPGAQSSGTFGTELHCPLCGRQVSTPLHRFPSEQLIGDPGAHVPALQVSPVVHGSPSLHGCPLPSSACTQPCC